MTDLVTMGLRAQYSKLYKSVAEEIETYLTPARPRWSFEL